VFIRIGSGKPLENLTASMSPVELRETSNMYSGLDRRVSVKPGVNGT
jgi:hypothetical protein